jgi:sec-independent protein translocase protein TatB
MFDIGGTELLVIAIVAIIVVGPKELPRMLRTLGQFVGKAKTMAREFQTHFNEAVEEAGLDEVRKGISSVEKATTSPDFGDTFKPITDVGKDIKREIEKPEASRSGEDEPAGAATAVTEAVTDKAPAESERKTEPDKKAEAGTSGGDATPGGY